MREAPALVLINKLLESGANIYVYDPIAMSECRRYVGDVVTYSKDMYEAVIDADALALITEWKQFRIPNWKVIRRAMKGNVIVDGRNIYVEDDLLAEGFEYLRIGK